MRIDQLEEKLRQLKKMLDEQYSVVVRLHSLDQDTDAAQIAALTDLRDSLGALISAEHFAFQSAAREFSTNKGK